jgi:hypothetical protein
MKKNLNYPTDSNALKIIFMMNLIKVPREKTNIQHKNKILCNQSMFYLKLYKLLNLKFK